MFAIIITLPVQAPISTHRESRPLPGRRDSGSKLLATPPKRCRINKRVAVDGKKSTPEPRPRLVGQIPGMAAERALPAVGDFVAVVEVRRAAQDGPRRNGHLHDRRPSSGRSVDLDLVQLAHEPESVSRAFLDMHGTR